MKYLVILFSLLLFSCEKSRVYQATILEKELILAKYKLVIQDGRNRKTVYVSQYCTQNVGQTVTLIE